MPDRDLSMLVANAIRRRTIDDDVFVRGIVSQIWTWRPVPCRCWWLGAITVTRQAAM